MEKESRLQRGDGKATREKLLQCAVHLAAKKGFASVTSKEICEMAGTNLAAVNYHFGSREGLHQEMLLMIHQHFLSEDFLQSLSDMDASPRKRLDLFCDELIKRLWSSEEWLIKVWIREILSGSPDVKVALQRIAFLKGKRLIQLFQDYTGLSRDDVRLYSCIISFVAPFLMTAIGKQSPLNYTDVTHMSFQEQSWWQSLKTFAFAGLDAVSVKNIRDRD